MATLATIAALPVLVRDLGNNGEGASSVAAVPGGADIAGSLRQAAGSSTATTRPTIPAQRSELPTATQPTQPTVLDIAIPASEPPTSAKGLATYRRFGVGRRQDPPCASPSIPVGARVKVENLDNGREIWCSVVSNSPIVGGLLLAIDMDGFVLLGDPVQSPIPVRVTW